MTSDLPDQDTPAEMVDRLLGVIRKQFCYELPDKKWFSMQNWFRVHVILWPARQMNKKGFNLPADRYESMLRGVFMDIKRHGATWAIKDWPGYLLKCVQDHWSHHWEEYYAEAKSARTLAERALMACRSAAKPEDRTVDTLAQAHALLAHKTRRKHIPQPKQQDLF